MSAQPSTPTTTWRDIAASRSSAFCCWRTALFSFARTISGLVIKMVIFALFAMSLDLLIGYAGLATLGHAAYFGMAAYATGLLALQARLGGLVRLPAGLVVAALTATLFGLLALRTRGSYFLMITLALSQVVWGIAFGWRTPDRRRRRPAGCAAARIWACLGRSPTTRTFYYFVLVLVGMARSCSFASSARPSATRCAASAKAKHACWRLATTFGATSSWLSSSRRPSPDSRAASMSTTTASSAPTICTWSAQPKFC